MALHAYTVHHASADTRTVLAQADSLIFVKEGFCWPALFVPFLWLVYRRMWLVLVLWLAASIAVGLLPEVVPLTAGMLTILGFGINLLMGLQGNDLLRWTLARRGRKEIAVVVGNGIAGAEHRFFQLLCDERQRMPDAPLSQSLPQRDPATTLVQSASRARPDYSILPEPGRL